MLVSPLRNLRVLAFSHITIVISFLSYLMMLCGFFAVLISYLGGALDVGEYIHEAAIREVLEETGIQCEFETLLSARHMPDYRPGVGDIYIICKLKPLTSEIKMQEDEIADCKWMNVCLP